MPGPFPFRAAKRDPLRPAARGRRAPGHGPCGFFQRGGCPRNRAKIKGGIRCLDAESLHVLRGTLLTPPGSFRPKALRSPQFRFQEPFVTDAVNGPKTLHHERHSRSKDPSPRLRTQTRRSFAAPPLRIRRSIAAVAGPSPKALRRAASPSPKALRCGCRSGPEGPSLPRISRSEDPLLRAPFQIRGPFVAQGEATKLNACRATGKSAKFQEFCG